MGLLIEYLKEPKNWLVHAIVGFILLYFMLFAPLDPLIRIGIIVCVITLNIVRMKVFDKK